MSESVVVELGELAPKIPSVNPAKFPDEVFDLLSIPAYDAGAPQVISGSEIGSNKQLVEPGDVMISKIVPHIRRVWVVPEPSAQGRRQLASSEWIVFRTDRVLNRWLRFYLLSDSFHAQFMNTVAGVGGSLLRARPQFVKKINLTIPPVAQQKKEAEVEELKATIQQKRERQQELFDELKSATFREMFLGKSFPNKKLFEVADTSSGATPNRSNKNFYKDGTIPWVKSGELHQELITSVSEKITDEALERTSVQLLPAGTILIAMYGATVGAVSQLGIEATTNQAVCAIQIKNPCITETYLKFYLRSQYNFILSQAAGGAQPNINQGIIKKLNIPIPPIKTQLEFEKILKILSEIF